VRRGLAVWLTSIIFWTVEIFDFRFLRFVDCSTAHHHHVLFISGAGTRNLLFYTTHTQRTQKIATGGTTLEQLARVTATGTMRVYSTPLPSSSFEYLHLVPSSAPAAPFALPIYRISSIIFLLI
jgi:hypothetical protein